MPALNFLPWVIWIIFREVYESELSLWVDVFLFIVGVFGYLFTIFKEGD